MRHSNRLPMLVACLLTGFVATAVSSSGQAQTFRDDEITLHSGQTLLGSVKEKATPKGKELQVQLDDGWTLLLDRETYTRWKPEPEAMAKYRELSAQIKHTLDDQLKMANWCDDNRLKSLAEKHYRIAIQIDPNNEVARKELGYINPKGEWINRAELKQRLGYQRIGTRWVLPEVEEVRRVQEERAKSESEAKYQIGLLLRKAFRNGRNQQDALTELRQLTDPAAVPGILDAIEDVDKDIERVLKSGRPSDLQLPLQKKQLFISVLCNIDSYASSKALTSYYLLDQFDPEARDRALETLLKRESHQRTLMSDFVAALSPDYLVDGDKVTDPDLNTSRMSRAAHGLGEIGIPYGIENLISALRVTYTKVTNVQPSSAFGGNGSAASNPGGGKLVENRTMECHEALDVLKQFTGQEPGFGFDQMAWVQWWVRENTPTNLDLRRD